MFLPLHGYLDTSSIYCLVTLKYLLHQFSGSHLTNRNIAGAKEALIAFKLKSTLREEPSQMNVLHHELPAGQLSIVCTVYKQ